MSFFFAGTITGTPYFTLLNFFRVLVIHIKKMSPLPHKLDQITPLQHIAYALPRRRNGLPCRQDVVGIRSPCPVGAAVVAVRSTDVNQTRRRHCVPFTRCGQHGRWIARSSRSIVYLCFGLAANDDARRRRWHCLLLFTSATSIRKAVPARWRDSEPKWASDRERVREKERVIKRDGEITGCCVFTASGTWN